ncbi:MAG: hypothetical protein K8I02_06155, partial [Candidatus Methylomirabilis sp.]|nr:hypothetical protein [Deltaproteobacteria bacterium]
MAAAVGYSIDTYNFADNSEFDSIDHNFFGEFAYRSPSGLGLRVFDQFLYGNSVTSFRNRSVAQDTSLALTGSDFLLNVLLANADYQILDDYFLRLGYVWYTIRYSDDVVQTAQDAVLPGTIIPLVDLGFDGSVLDYDVHTFTGDVIVTRLAKTVITAQFLAAIIQGAAKDEIVTLAGGAVGTILFKDDPRDATVWQGTVNFQRQFTEKLRVSLGGGIQYRDYVHNRIESVFTPPAPASPVVTAGRQGDKFAALANFEAVWRMSPFTDWILSFDRTPASSTDLDSLVVVNLITGRVRQRFGRKISVEAGAQYALEEVEPGAGLPDRTEKVFTVFLRPGWQIQSWLAVRGQY